MYLSLFLPAILSSFLSFADDAVNVETGDDKVKAISEIDAQLFKLNKLESLPLAADIDELVSIYQEVGLFKGEWNCKKNQGVIDYCNCVYSALNLGTPPGALVAKKQGVSAFIKAELEKEKVRLSENLEELLYEEFKKGIAHPKTSIERFHELLCSNRLTKTKKAKAISSLGAKLKSLPSGNTYLLKSYLGIEVGEQPKENLKLFCGNNAKQYIANAYLQ